MTSKYDALGDHLADIGAETITLTFAAVEVVVGPLPVEARHKSAWWGRGDRARFGQSHALHWRTRATWRIGPTSRPGR